LVVLTVIYPGAALGRWKWWKEQNCYLQHAQSVAMGNADIELQNDRSFREEMARLAAPQ
jgi:hypothetical protein